MISSACFCRSALPARPAARARTPRSASTVRQAKRCSSGTPCPGRARCPTPAAPSTQNRRRSRASAAPRSPSRWCSCRSPTGPRKTASSPMPGLLATVRLTSSTACTVRPCAVGVAEVEVLELQLGHASPRPATASRKAPAARAQTSASLQRKSRWLKPRMMTSVADADDAHHQNAGEAPGRLVVLLRQLRGCSRCRSRGSRSPPG